VLSDALYFLVYRLLHYRVKVVRKNISESFPEKDASELRHIERGFYHWFCDYIVESVKLLTMSQRQMKRRLVFKGTDVVDQVVAEGQSCAVYLGHYCNCEWITSLPLWVTPAAQCGQIYHAIENPLFDRLFLRLRQRFGAVCIPMAETLRRIIKYRQEGRPVVIGYIGDQVPFWNNIHHWCQFLNHDTPVLTGTERLARQTGHAVFYMDVRRVRRGYYEAEFKVLSLEPKKLAEFELTDLYFQHLEETIRRDPPYWLWTHNRWKRTHEEFLQRLDPETGIVDTSGTMWRVKERMEREKGKVKSE
jgi:KDO2-lipid IV(A) lauroyltransferase